jgi:hypothetical protein
MTPDEIGRILAQAAQRALPEGEDGDRAAARAEAAILKDLRPVAPLAPSWLYILILLLLFAAAAVDSASVLGMAGLRALSPPQRALIFAALFGAASLAAVACSRQMRPASGKNLAPLAWILAPSLLAPVFALVLSGYDLLHFVHEGIPCLVAGLGVAVPTGFAISLLLRRGFVLDWSAAGLAAGVLGGLAGVAMLEMHCPNLKAIHVMVWHMAVVLVSGALGFLVGRISRAAGLRW